MSNSIVVVNVSVTAAPAPSTLQSTGALISQGGTNLAAQSTSLLTQLSDLTPLLAAPILLASLSSSGTTATATLESTTIASGSYNSTTGLVTLTLAASVGIEAGNPIYISGATGTGAYADIDGTFNAASVTNSGETVTFFIATGLTMTISGGDASATTGLADGVAFLTNIAGSSTAGYNGNVVATVASATTFTFTVASGLTSPAVGSITFTPPTQADLLSMATTFFGQGGGQAVYVLELGAGTPAQGVTALTTFITANPSMFYAYLTPRQWDAVSSFLTFLAGFEALTSKTYFFITTSLANYASYTKAMKCAFLMVEAPSTNNGGTRPVTEFSAAAPFHVALSYNPSTTNKVTPMAFSFLYGVTPYPLVGNSTLFSTLKAAGVNWVGTGAEGGIATSILFWGTTADVNQFTYWYSVDWVQINIDLALSNAIINGSNNPANPLLYNQQGINALQGVAAATMSSGVSYGLVLNGPVLTALTSAQLAAALDAGTYVGLTVVNAWPFASYATANPSNYQAGIYGGFTVVYTPQLGFEQIIFNVNVSQFPSGT